MANWAITEPLTAEQLDAVALNILIKDVNTRINQGISNLPPPRSPSPPPEYDTNGKRINTRAQRYEKELLREQTTLVDAALIRIPGYCPPENYNPVRKTSEKFWLPVHDYPHINFMGLLLGPRGNTLRKMETESGAKIAIRGRGSVREGGRLPQGHSNDDLHCIVSGDSEEKIKAGIEQIQAVVDQAITSPEHENELKRGQLRELARITGTLRDFDGDKTGPLTCRRCGGKGHYARDCTESEFKKSSAEESEFDKIVQQLFTGNNQNNAQSRRKSFDNDNIPTPPQKRPPPPGINMPPQKSTPPPPPGVGSIPRPPGTGSLLPVALAKSGPPPSRVASTTNTTPRKPPPPPGLNPPPTRSADASDGARPSPPPPPPGRPPPASHPHVPPPPRKY